MAEQRYRVIERLEAGGMAEVFLGEAAGAQGFKKRVAIKRVLPHLAQNKRFMSMFLDEARLGARLNHANIVTCFDIGAADNTYFIVMEFVDGANLKTIIETLRKQGRPFPLKEAIYLMIEASRGLSYAHELTDDDGAPLNIVHRDVSPPNIMITKRGEVKVTDFGLAKATTQLEKTDPGVVKGKFSYLAPEAAMGNQVDARADIFAMGIVLWEMLAGRRLFLGESDYQTVKMVQAAQVPSLSRLNPDVDANLEELIGTALARDPERRFQNARELVDAFAGYLFSHRLKVTSFDIANLVSSVLAVTKKPKQEHSIIDRLIQEELLRFTSLDELSDPLNPGTAEASPDQAGEGARPIELGSFENPGEWFPGDGDVERQLDPGKSTPGWRETGAEGDVPSRSDPPPGDLASVLEEETEPAASNRADSSRPRAPTQAATDDAAGSSNTGRTLLYVGLTVVVILGTAAALWFTGVIPHR